ncbi:MAG: hypothetical protein LCH26_02020 [Proteobacteria bacterium]|nr:hypothetical protein [Pseudomonadota bacterium]
MKTRFFAYVFYTLSSVQVHASLAQDEERTYTLAERLRGAYMNEEYPLCDPHWYHNNATHKYHTTLLDYFAQQDAQGVLSDRAKGIYDHLRAIKPGQWKDSRWQNLDDILTWEGVQRIKQAHKNK